MRQGRLTERNRQHVFRGKKRSIMTKQSITERNSITETNSHHGKKQSITERNSYVMASCNSQKETDSMSFAERSSLSWQNSLSWKETVYHDDKTVFYGKKQSITEKTVIMERNSPSQKETVYHGNMLTFSFCVRLFLSVIYSISRKNSHHGKKQLSKTETVYQGKKQSITERKCQHVSIRHIQIQ